MHEFLHKGLAAGMILGASGSPTIFRHAPLIDKDRRQDSFDAKSFLLSAFSALCQAHIDEEYSVKMMLREV